VTTTTHTASDPQWEGLTFGKKGNVVSDKYHRVYSNQLSTPNGLLIRAQECQELMIGCYALSNTLKFSTGNQLPAFLSVPIVKLQCPIRIAHEQHPNIKIIVNVMQLG
jgi:hypothetical protein